MTTRSKEKRSLSLVGGLMPQSSRKTRFAAEARTKKGHSYKPLPKEFRRDGFQYRQIARTGNAAIFEQTWDGCRNPSVFYEVIRIRCRDGFHIGGRFVEAADVYPKSEAWGTDGFSVPDRETAFRRLREISGSLNAPERVGQKRKRSRLEKSPT
jgi:hypothetical protein